MKKLKKNMKGRVYCNIALSFGKAITNNYSPPILLYHHKSKSHICTQPLSTRFISNKYNLFSWQPSKLISLLCNDFVT